MKYPYSKMVLLVLCGLLIFIPQSRLLAQAPPLLWQKCYGGDSTDEINCIRQTSDGGYIAAGYTYSVDGDLAANGGITGLWVLKLDPFGVIEWEKTYSDTLAYADYIEPTYDGGYILTGSKTIKLHNDGSIDWIDNITGTKIHQTTDSGYILCNANGYGGTNNLYKLYADGSITWQQNYNKYQITIYDVCQSFVDGYLISGSIYDIYNSPFVTKIDDSGNISVVDDYSHGSDNLLCKTKDGKYFNAIFSTSGYTVSKIDDTLTTDWTTKTISNSMSDIAATNDNGFVDCGSNSSSSFGISVIKFDNLGNQQWEKDFGNSYYDQGNSCFQAANGNYVVAGSVQNDGTITGNHGGRDGWIAEFGDNVGVSSVSSAATEIKLYPVPATDKIFIDLPQGYENANIQIIDVSGNQLQVKEDNNGLSRILHLSDLPAGQYLLEVFNDGIFNSYKITHY